MQPPAPGSTPESSPAAASGYDLVAQQLIPGYASLALLSVALLSASPLASAQGASVLVAGCGTGAELLAARSHRPDWRLTALDPSASMLAIARSRLGEAAAIDWRCQTVEQLSGESAFDGALSVLVLQSLPDDGSKLAFLTALARSLRPGGQLVLIDLMKPERSPLQAQVEAAWLGFQRASGVRESAEALVQLAGGLHPIGLSRLTALVNAAGFSDPASVFQALDVQGFLLQRRG
ncbi:MAG: class I SAM-dependent methyltransferase [Cyanobium sp.]